MRASPALEGAFQCRQSTRSSYPFGSAYSIRSALYRALNKNHNARLPIFRPILNDGEVQDYDLHPESTI